MNTEDIPQRKRNDTLGSTLKLFALVAIYGGLFGTGFQKAIIMSSQLGNLSGNYEVREIFHSTVLGISHFLYLLDKKIIASLLHSIFTLEIVIAATLVACAFVIARIIRLNPHHKTHHNIKRWFNSKKNSRWAYPFVFIATWLSTIMAIFIAKFVALILFTASLTILVLGYFTGESWVNTSIENKPCSPATEETLQQKRIVQCTQFNFNGKKIMGELLLETPDGHLIRRNESFLFYSKDGSRCFYSKFIVPNENKSNLDNGVNFQDIDPQVTEFCTSVKS